MTTETETSTGSAGLTAAEQAYFDSRGTKTEGLGIEADVGGAAAAVTEAPKPDLAPKPAATETAKADAAAAKTGADLDPDEEPLGDDGRPKNPGRFIRFGAFDKERQRRVALEGELKTEREARAAEQVKQARAAERLELLSAALAPLPKPEAPTAAAEPPPDPEKDIFGYVRWQDQRLADLTKQLGEVTGQVGKVQQTSAAQLAETNLKTAYVGDAQRFAAANPDFGAAYQHLLQSRDRQLAHLGETDPAKRAAIIAAEERGIVEGALKAGQSPAERVYGLAGLMGYVKASAATEANGGAAPAAAGVNIAAATAANGNGSAGAGSGAAANGAAAGAAAPSVTEEIDRIKRGTEASKSLSSAGGSAGGLTIEALASMPQEEFDSWLAKASRAQVRAVMGG